MPEHQLLPFSCDMALPSAHPIRSPIRVFFTCANCGLELVRDGNAARIQSTWYAPLGWLQSHWIAPGSKNALHICPTCMILLWPVHRAQVLLAQKRNVIWRKVLKESSSFDDAVTTYRATVDPTLMPPTPNGWSIKNRALHRFDGPISGISYGIFLHDFGSFNPTVLQERYQFMGQLTLQQHPDCGIVLCSPTQFWGLQLRNQNQKSLGIPEYIRNKEENIVNIAHAIQVFLSLTLTDFRLPTR